MGDRAIEGAASKIESDNGPAGFALTQGARPALDIKPPEDLRVRKRECDSVSRRYGTRSTCSTDQVVGVNAVRKPRCHSRVNNAPFIPLRLSRKVQCCTWQLKRLDTA